MDRDEQIEELLVDWEMARLDGQPKSAQQICAEAGCPELLEDVRERISVLEKTSWIFDATRSEDSPDSSAAFEPLPKLIDRYEILGEVGQGGMGTVYRARHTSMNREVAIKTLSRATLSDTRRERFLREIQTIASLTHPNIVTAYDALEHDGESFLVMELVDGEDLDSLVKREGPMDPQLANEIMVQIAGAAQAAHEKGIVHRDIKPSNILLAKDGTAKLLDLGISRIQSEFLPEDENGLSGSSTLTQENVPVGTVAFMSPEQAMDARKADARSDVYSLGCTLYWLLTGKAVVGSENSIQTIVGHREMEVEPLVDALDIEPNDKARLAKMLAREPVDRFQSMQGIIDSYQTGNRIQRPRVAKSASKKPALLLVATAMLGVAAGLVAFLPGWNAATNSSPIPGSTSGAEFERDLARWIINNQGAIVANTSLGQQVIDNVEGLPSGSFDIDEVYIVGMSDEISFESFASLENLKSISLVECIVSSSGTSSLSSLKNLELLSLDDCDLPSSFWHQLSNAPALKSLSLNSCGNPEEGVKWPELPQLESLTVTNSWFDDEDLKQMGALDRLKVLDLNNTEVNEEAFKFASTHPKLEELDLSYGDFESVDLSQVPVSKNLKTLYLIELEGAKGLADFLAKHESLSQLSVQGVNFSDEDLEALESCSKLNYLDIASTKVTPGGLAMLKRFPSLDALDVSNLDLKDDDLRRLGDLDLDLVELSLNGNPISAKGLQHLMKMPLLLIDVSDCNLSAEVLDGFLDDHPTCETVIDGELDGSGIE